MKCVKCGNKECKEGFCHNCNRCWDCMDKKCSPLNKDCKDSEKEQKVKKE